MAYEWFLASPQALLGELVTTLAMYAAVLVFVRAAGVRSFAEMSAFDVAIVVAIGSTIATTIVAESPSLMAGGFALLLLYGCQLVVSRWRSRMASVERTVDNRPIRLMGEGGRMLAENMRVARVTEDDLRRIVRSANIVDYTTIQAVVMEGTGSVNVLHGHSEALADSAWVLENVRDYSA